jgi:fibronectin type 3 domain-containing protein
VSNATASQVSLTWTASASTTVVGYNVYRGTTSGGPYTKVNLAIVAAPAFTDMSVASGTTYYYVVTAVDPGNLESINSNEVSATTPPQPPTSLAVTNVTASQVTLTWTASTTASVVSYNVYRSTTSGSGYVQIGSVNAVAASFTDMTVASAATYFYVLTAVGPGNVESVKSNEVSATTPPQPPTGLSATAQGTAPNESVFLSWSASAGTIAGYNVYRSTTNGSGFVLQNASLITALSYTDSTVQNGSNTTYYYVVTAVGGSGAESAVSNQASAVVP